MQYINRFISTLALAAIGASMAQADAYGYPYGIASASYYQSGSGLYLTGVGGQYYSYYSSAFGTGWSAYDSYLYQLPTQQDALQLSYAYGGSNSWPVPGGSGFVSNILTYSSATITNLSNSYDTLFIDVYTAGYAAAGISGWNNSTFADGYATFSDYQGLVLQTSGAVVSAYGLPGGYDYTLYGSYDPINGYTTGGATYGSLAPFNATVSATDYEVYAITFAPGASDTFWAAAGEAHISYSITPGPTAIAPFALGLFGALRRRRRV